MKLGPFEVPGFAVGDCRVLLAQLPGGSVQGEHGEVERWKEVEEVKRVEYRIVQDGRRWVIAKRDCNCWPWLRHPGGRVRFFRSFDAAERYLDKLTETQKLAWERHAEKDRAYQIALDERDEARDLFRQLTDGAFLGVKSDEMGNWYRRVAVPPPAPASEVTCGTCGHWGGDPEALLEAWCRILRRLTQVDSHVCKRDHYTPRADGR